MRGLTSILGILVVTSLCIPMKAVASLEDELANICTIVKNDDKTQLRKKLTRIEKEYRLKLAKFYDSLRCNNLELIRFAVIHNSDDAGVYLTRKLSRSSLGKMSDDGLTLQSWAEVNGYTSSKIIESVIKRLN